MREGFVFYRSFFEAMKELPSEDFAIIFKALCDYALDDMTPDLTGIHKALFELIKPQIDANNRRYENGKKGGAPVGNSNAAKKEKQPKTTKNNLKIKIK